MTISGFFIFFVDVAGGAFVCQGEVFVVLIHWGCDANAIAPMATVRESRNNRFMIIGYACKKNTKLFNAK